MQKQTVTRVSFNGCTYGITFFENSFGVCKGAIGRIKYMPVNLKLNSPYFFPDLLKTRLNMMNTAEGLYNNLLTCAKLQTYFPVCISVCEHVLKYGHTPR